MKGRSSYLVVGFITGVIYVAACGGGSSVNEMANAAAEEIGNAIDVVFSNTDSGLTATTVQGAIDELATSVNQVQGNLGIESSDYEASLVGTWTGTAYSSKSRATTTPLDFNITLNADGSYSCSGSDDIGVGFSTTGYECTSPGEWEVVDQMLIIHNSSGGGNYSTVFEIKKLSNASLGLLLPYSNYSQSYAYFALSK